MARIGKTRIMKPLTDAQLATVRKAVATYPSGYEMRLLATVDALQRELDELKAKMQAPDNGEATDGSATTTT